jgi:transposase
MAGKQRKQAPPAKWAEAKAAYRCGEGSLRELAERFGLSPSTLMKRAASEHWEDQRKQVGSKAEARAVEKDVESVAEMLSKHRRAAARIAELTLAKLEEAALEDEGITASTLDTLSLVLARMAPMERLAAGIDRAKPAAVLDEGDGDEVVCEIDAPDEDAAAAAKPKAVGAAA